MKIGSMVAQTDIPPKQTGGMGREASEETMAVLRAAKDLADGQALALECDDKKDALRWGARGKNTAFKAAGLTSAVRGLQVFIYKNGVHAE